MQGRAVQTHPTSVIHTLARHRRDTGTHHAKVEAMQALANHARVNATGPVPQPLFVQMGLAQGITPQAFGMMIPLPLVSVLDAAHKVV